MAPADANEVPHLAPDVLREELLRWFEGRRATRVRLVENDEPPNDEYDDYQVDYKASFEPDTLEQARVEVWGASDGSVAIGFERRDRLARRLGVKCYEPFRFVGGHEPGFMALPELIAFLDGVADGQVAALVTILPWLGITSARVVAPPPLLQKLHGSDRPWRWLRARPQRRPTGLHRILDYSRWE